MHTVYDAVMIIIKSRQHGLKQTVIYMISTETGRLKGVARSKNVGWIDGERTVFYPDPQALGAN